MQQEQKPANKALSTIKPNNLTRVLSYDHRRSIDNILRGFHSFTNLSDSEYRHKSKMIMLLRDEKSGIKSGNIMKNGKSYLVKEYFKYVFLRIRTITAFHI